MEKKTYETPEMEVIELENDVILTSGESEGYDWYNQGNNVTNHYDVC